jgi:hypothetical protein
MDDGLAAATAELRSPASRRLWPPTRTIPQECPPVCNGPNRRMNETSHERNSRTDKGAVAVLVALFMELVRSRPVDRLAALAGMMFLVVMFGLTMTDVLWRLLVRN